MPPPVRGTQSFVGTLSLCWSRPSLVLIEIAWRWVYGIPTLALVLWQVKLILARNTAGTMSAAALGLDRKLLSDPVGALSADPIGAASKFTKAFTTLLPDVEHAAFWLLPILLLAWAVVSSVGRTLVLRRASSDLRKRFMGLVALQLIRLFALATVIWVWFWCVQASAGTAITQPISSGAEPNLVLYCAMVIIATLGLFTMWAAVSWIFSVAPLLAMLRGSTPLASIRAALDLSQVKGKLVEVNLVLGIVKIALIVLAMVFSATPLPFESVTTPEFLAWWWFGVALLYLIASDFFHVARLLGYLELLRVYDASPRTTTLHTEALRRT